MKKPKNLKQSNDDLDELAQSQAPLIDHLFELRQRLLKSLLTFSLAFGLAFAMADRIFNLLLIPYQKALGGQEAVRLIYTAPQEFLLTEIKLSFFGAFILAFPMMAYQLYQFIAPGLYKKERYAFLPFLLVSPFLFLCGIALVYFVIMPLALGFFSSMETSMVEMLPRVSEYLSLIMALMIAFGLCFQLPLLIALLLRIGLVTAETLARSRSYVIVGVFALAAFLTPPDIISQIGLALPTLLLYEASILGARLIERRAS